MLHDRQETNKCQKFYWDDEADRRLIRMRVEGYTFPRIANLLGVPSEKICRERYHKLRPDCDLPPQAKWTEEQMRQFQALYEQREPMLSMDAIAKQIGRTKGSVCGLRRRMKLPHRPKIAEAGKRNPYGRPVHNKRADGRERAPKIKKERVIPTTLATLTLEEANAQGFENGGKTFVELGSSCCRFIKGDVRAGDHRFCGSKAIPGKSWCPGHYRVVYRGASDLHQQLARPYDVRKK